MRRAVFNLRRCGITVVQYGRSRPHPLVVIPNLHNSVGAEPLEDPPAAHLPGKFIPELSCRLSGARRAKVKLGTDERRVRWT
jgi:hypothetical protein